MKEIKSINTAIKSNEVIETSKMLNLKGGLRGTQNGGTAKGSNIRQITTTSKK